MRKILPLMGVALLLFACNPDGNVPVQDPTVLINKEAEVLSKRLSLEGTGVVGIIPSAFINGRISEDELPAGKIPMMVVSQVSPPSYEGIELMATHVDISDNYAFVSYNVAGPRFLGAIEIFDISDPLQPKITSQAVFKHADINALVYRDGVLYAAGAFDIDQEPGVKTAAQLVRVNVSNGNFTSDFLKYDIEGFAAVDVDVKDGKVAVASGSNGLIGIFDQKGQMTDKFPLGDLRSLKFGDKVIAALSGTEGIKILDAQSLKELSSIKTGVDAAESKRTLDMAMGMIFASEGSKGVGVYGGETGEMLQRLSIPLNPNGVQDEDIVTNAVSFDNGRIFMANGGAGVSVSEVSGSDIIEELGILGISGSSNFIKAYKGFIFVASGRKGLQILSLAVKDEQVIDPGIDCTGLSAYTGNANLNVNSNEELGYAGAAALKNVNVGGKLTYCGSLTIENSLNINSGGLFQINGAFVFGQYNRNNTLSINSNATLKISGEVVIYGDLNLNSGATLEFVGQNDKITIFGRVNKGSGVTIKGDFEDTEGKLK
ncbi:hypothetical protein [Mariniradius sediminis]|uniref:LVIVD repeat-containing protein n=1 Tax=Mariniradius sediminis TaxID=2909237 RepID=A0ABS9BNV1_9BACT|nr:hypothetical protein [Mariniradius sediminis]MCF1749702.1 hypothetical protein [Mariniradius sediminis]